MATAKFTKKTTSDGRPYTHVQLNRPKGSMASRDMPAPMTPTMMRNIRRTMLQKQMDPASVVRETDIYRGNE